MILVAGAFGAVAAFVHVYIFVLESLRWTAESTRRTFGLTAEEALATRSLAFNQGFYNLFLALTIFVGLCMMATTGPVGFALTAAGTASMTAAAAVLVVSDRAKLRPGLIQGSAPALCLVFLALAA